MGIDDKSSHPELCSEVADGVTRFLLYPGGVCLFREPDAGNLPVRFDEREQETGSSQTGLRWAKRKLSPTATGRLTPLRLFSTLLPITLIMVLRWALECNRLLTSNWKLGKTTSETKVSLRPLSGHQKSSALLSSPLALSPPAGRTWPLFSKVAVWSARAFFIVLAAAQVPFVGL